VADPGGAPSQILKEPDNTQIHTVFIDSLVSADSPRLVGEDPEHIRLLAESGAALPPILVHRPTMRVVDGMHRLRVARLLGRQTIPVRFVEGTVDDAFVVAVKANTTHGLPLSIGDREAAAARIILSHPHWSDRAVAAVTGLAPRTAAAVRQRSGAPEPTARVGRDGRARPTDSTERRRVASQIIAERPDTPLREVARTAGISPSTAMDVRQRMRRGDDQAPGGRSNDGRRPPGTNGAPKPARPSQPIRDPVPAEHREVILQNLKNDPSLRFADSGRRMLRWLFTHATHTIEWREFLAETPPHCAYTLAAVARGCANDWLEYANELERRAANPRRSSDIARPHNPVTPPRAHLTDPNRQDRR
jgi:hypothetical protein